MKLTVTESQYSFLIKENKMDDYIIKIINEISDYPLQDVLNSLWKKYGLNHKSIGVHENLSKFVNGKINEYMYNPDGGGNALGFKIKNVPQDMQNYVFDYVKEIVTDGLYKIEKENNTPTEKIRLLSIYQKMMTGRLFDETMYRNISNLKEGQIDDVVDYEFKRGIPIRSVLKNISSIKKYFTYREDGVDLINERIRTIGKKHGYVLVPKSLGFSFEEGGGRIQQIIDYIKDKPKLPQKTRKGWMSYVGEDPDRKGWNSTLWRAVQNAGIIQKQRDGVGYTYSLGPNADPFEKGNLVGY